MTDPSTSRIRVLPELLVRKIAAGEVIERPASVVKELVENALDAGARRVSVAIEEGGKQLIRVTDDGCGMSAEELRLAVTPHATSKVYVEQDLYHIETLGFRGEALASISAVSRMRVVSRPADRDEGHEIRIAAEEVEVAQAAGCPPGTSIEVRDLFFNVPARRKFLRANSTETGHVNDQLVRAALAHPSVAFELSSNGRRTQNLAPAATRQERLGQLFGAELAEALLHTERDEAGLRLDVYAAPPAHSRASAQWQYVLVNGRYVRDRFLQHAVKEAYRGLLDPNRHPVVFVFLDIDPAEVDVNVHPTKIEVRWANSNLVHSQVLSALRETFQRTDLMPRLQTPARNQWQDENDFRRAFAASLKATPPIQPGGSEGGAPSTESHGPANGSYSPGYAGPAGPGDPHSAERVPLRPSADAVEAGWRALYRPADAPAAPAGVPDDDETIVPSRPPLVGGKPRAVQMHNLYLVVETADGIVIIDQHALHERVLYEELCRRITEGALESQRLLLPETVRVTPRQVALLEEHRDVLSRLGMEVEPFGPDTIAVQSLPTLLKSVDPGAFCRDLLDKLEQEVGGRVETEVIIHDLLDMMACKAAVKAGDPLSPGEIETLVQRTDLVDKVSACPHGRPTMLRLTRSELERQFKRT